MFPLKHECHTTMVIAHLPRVAEDLPRVAEELHKHMCALATSDELKDTLKAMNAASAFGPDGIPICFYRSFFSAIQSALLVMVNGFLVDG